MSEHPTTEQTIEAALPAWIVESAEMPNFYTGVVTNLSLCAWVLSIDGQGKIPDGSTLPDQVRPLGSGQP